MECEKIFDVPIKCEFRHYRTFRYETTYREKRIIRCICFNRMFGGNKQYVLLLVHRVLNTNENVVATIASYTTKNSNFACVLNCF